MTFEEFQATRKAVDNVAKAIGCADWSDGDLSGWVYAGLMYIEAEQVQPSWTLEQLERDLYDEGVAEGWL